MVRTLSLMPRNAWPLFSCKDEDPAHDTFCRMLAALIEQANQRCRQRLRDAFAEFSAGEGAQKILQLDSVDQLPPAERIRMPYDDAKFDWVVCYGLIEHYSNHERQVRFVRELLRIARNGVFISTPNRHHPLASVLRPERDISLLDALDIKALVDVLPGRPPWKLGHVRMVGLKAYYFLMIWKAGKAAGAPSQ